MNPRRVMTWVIFWASVAIALGALAWVTVEVVALERREANSRAQAVRQETIRRALWRMDSRMAPILAIEASRPISDYHALEGTEASWIRGAGLSDAASFAAPALPSGDAYARLYFNLDQGDDPHPPESAQSQQIATLINSSNAANDGSASAYTGGYSQRGDAGHSQDQPAAPQPALKSAPQSDTPLAAAPLKVLKDADSDYEARKRVAEMASQSVQSEQLRDQSVAPQIASDAQAFTIEPAQTRSGSLPGEPGSNEIAPGNAGQGVDMPPATSTPPPVGSLKPRWVRDDRGDMQLVLVRSATLGGKPVTQGVWLNWDALRADLLGSVDDVLPGASLVPVREQAQSPSVYQLATIPVAFIPPAPALTGAWRWSPATVGLLVTWIAIIATIIAVGVVLRAAIVLSQRRGRFVSAVTHELRTPLTTFRLYAQMLADGMVTDEQVKRDYLSTLKRESERLTGIVENVLEYARLSRQRSSKDKPAGVQTLSPGALVARFRPTLARRVGQSNLDLVVSLDLDAHQDRTVTVDPHGVERIMMNLIENACKYAAPSEDQQSETEDFDTRIHLEVSVKDDTLELLVADHGPGIAPGERARIFGEFQRGIRALGNARSGLGLGLALSRGLAREMGGDLNLTRRRAHGAEFLLTIPLDVEAVGSRQ